MITFKYFKKKAKFCAQMKIHLNLCFPYSCKYYCFGVFLFLYQLNKINTDCDYFIFCCNDFAQLQASDKKFVGLILHLYHHKIARLNLNCTRDTANLYYYEFLLVNLHRRCYMTCNIIILEFYIYFVRNLFVEYL
jgi:hypothetical protein